MIFLARDRCDLEDVAVLGEDSDTTGCGGDITEDGAVSPFNEMFGRDTACGTGGFAVDWEGVVSMARIGRVP